MVIRNRFIFIAFVFLFPFFSYLSFGQSFLEEEEPPENYQIQVFLEEKDALARIFSGCDEIETEFLLLSPKGSEFLKGLLKRQDLETSFQIYLGKRRGVVDRYAIITEEMGCFHPITWILSTDTKGKIFDIAVMVYRETRGHEVSRKRFLKQFEGKSYNDPFSTNKDIIKITGATVSVHAVCRGVKKMLTVINEFYIKKNPASAALVRRLTPKEASSMQTSHKQVFTTARIIHGVKAIISAEMESERQFFSLTDKAFREMERIEELFTKELKALNSIAGKRVYSCNKEVFDVLKRCYQYSELTEGAFAITVAPLLEQWGIYKGTGRRIKDKKLMSLKPAASYKNLIINNHETRISFAHKKTKVDPGPVVRGYAVDRALEIFESSGVSIICINYGSITRMLQPPSEKNAWKIGIPHPEKETSVVGSLPLVNRGVAFVADYSRLPTVQDKFYIHLIDPKTGRPIENETLAAVSIASTAEEAAILATVLFVTGAEGMQKYSATFPDKEWLILMEKSKGNIAFQTSPGIEKRLTEKEEKIYKFGKGSGCPFSP